MKKTNSTDSLITVDKLNYFYTKLKDKMEDLIMPTILKLVYPVGKLYFSMESISPATLMPGTSWLQITDKVIRAADNTATGGGLCYFNRGPISGAYSRYKTK